MICKGREFAPSVAGQGLEVPSREDAREAEKRGSLATANWYNPAE